MALSAALQQHPSSRHTCKNCPSIISTKENNPKKQPFCQTSMWKQADTGTPDSRKTCKGLEDEDQELLVSLLFPALLDT
jgi:hypothetical protein